MLRLRPLLKAISALPRLSYSSSSTTTASQLQITSNCVARLKDLRSKRGKEVVLRVTVDGGGCSGFQYAFELEDWDTAPDPQTLPSEEDVLIEKDGAAVIVDNLSLNYIAGAKVDFVEEMISSSFRVTDNPNSESSCGCGVSFSPK